MTEQDKQKLNEKLARWLFPTVDAIDIDDECMLITWSDRKGNEVIRLFTDSLDACFKWLVPKLQDKSQERILEEIHLYPQGSEWLCELDMILVEYNEYRPEKCKVPYSRAETPTLALCLAIEKLINEETK